MRRTQTQLRRSYPSHRSAALGRSNEYRHDRQTRSLRHVAKSEGSPLMIRGYDSAREGHRNPARHHLLLNRYLVNQCPK